MDPSPNSAEDQLAQTAWVRRLARNILRDPGLAEDAAQESAIAAWRHGPFDTHARASWLSTAVRRLAGRMRRGEARRASRERSAARAEALPSAAELVERAEAHRALVAAVLALEEPYRSTILLRYVEDLPPRAIARRAGVPVATVKTRLARGLERLRRELGRGHGDARAWVGLLVPLAHTHPAPPLVLAITLVKTLKIAVVVLAALLLATGLFWTFRPRAEPALARLPESPGALARSDSAEIVGERPESSGAGRIAEQATAGESPADPAALPASERLRGRVLDLADGPIAGARVRFFSTPWYGYAFEFPGLAQTPSEIGETVSAADGCFSTELAYGALVGLRVSAAGFAEERLEGKFGGDEILVRLGRPAAIAGLVTRASDGTPVSGAIVRVNAGTEEAVESVVRTGGDGRYRCDDLPPGPIGMLVAPELDAMTRWEELVLEPGQTLQHDVQVAAGELVRGRVLDRKTGAPIEGAEVSAWSFVYKTVRTDAHGAFEIGGTPARQLVLMARALGYGRLEQRVLDTSGEVELRLERGLRARGRVLAAGGQPLAGVFAAAIGYAAGAGISRQDLCTGTSAADGSFELADLRVDLTHVLMLRAAGFGARFLAFPASASDPLEFGDIVLEPAAVLEGRVLDAGGRARQGVSVGLRPLRADPTTISVEANHGQRGLETDSGGRFVFRDLAPGEWALKLQGRDLAPPPERELRLAAGEFRRGYDIRLGEELAIEGWVGDEQGHALAGVWVTPLPEDGSRGAGALASDADGRFRIPGLKPGSYTLKAQGPRSDTETVARFEELLQRHVAAGTSGLELRLRARSSSIRGRVLEADGTPAAGAFVFRIEAGLPPAEFVLTDAEGRFELPVVPGDGLQLVAQRGIPLSKAMRTPSGSEARVGRVVDDDASARVLSEGIRAGSADVELRLKSPR